MYPVVPVLRPYVRCCSWFLEVVELTYMNIFGAMILVLWSELEVLFD
jgi:hypothetical protein